jgi:hypothetical protein
MRRWEEAQAVALDVVIGHVWGDEAHDPAPLPDRSVTAAELAGCRLPPRDLGHHWREAWADLRAELCRRLIHKGWPVMVVHLVTSEGLAQLRSILRGEETESAYRTRTKGGRDGLA